ncbi:hypothetical protein ES705_35412 [subsurface metagenome]
MLIPYNAACTIAFCSACNPLHNSCLSPEATFFISLKHPISKQWGSPLGAPLYPVVSIRLSCTITAPTFLLKQVERLETNSVISTKYSSQVGRLIN